MIIKLPQLRIIIFSTVVGLYLPLFVHASCDAPECPLAWFLTFLLQFFFRLWVWRRLIDHVCQHHIRSLFSLSRHTRDRSHWWHLWFGHLSLSESLSVPLDKRDRVGTRLYIQFSLSISHSVQFSLMFKVFFLVIFPIFYLCICLLLFFYFFASNNHAGLHFTKYFIEFVLVETNIILIVIQPWSWRGKPVAIWFLKQTLSASILFVCTNLPGICS